MKAQYVAVLLGSLLASSCAHMFDSHMRVVKSQPGKGGVMAIPQGMDGGANAKREAEDAMIRNCGSGKYEITEEGETVVGTQKSEKTNTDNPNKYGTSSSTSGTTQDLTEWRITYVCKK